MPTSALTVWLNIVYKSLFHLNAVKKRKNLMHILNGSIL